MGASGLQKRRGLRANALELRHILKHKGNVGCEPSGGRSGIQQKSAPRSIAIVMLPKKLATPGNRDAQSVQCDVHIVVQEAVGSMPNAK
jgi:hypothetical protein